MNQICTFGTKPNLLNQIYQTKSTKLNLQNTNTPIPAWAELGPACFKGFSQALLGCFEVFQIYFKGASGMFPGSFKIFKDVSMVFLGGFNGGFQLGFKCIMRVFQKWITVVSRVFQGVF